MILDGKKITENIYNQLIEKIQSCEKAPCLWVILVWNEDSPSMRYIRQKRREAKKVGIDFRLSHLPQDISQQELIETIQAYNQDRSISWYIVQLPLPNHIDTLGVIRNIDPKKDVDGFHPENQWKVMIWDTTGFTPCTPAGVMEMLSYYDIDLPGKQVTILGQSNIVGKPMSQLCINAWATVSSCNSRTPDISLYTKNADIIISATWIAHLITTDIVRKNAVIIDVWFSIQNGEIYGDCEYKNLLSQWNSITPVPGWVWPMTVAMLLTNTYKAHKNS